MRYGVREFELTLMHRMRDVNAGRVEEALRAMGATRAELRAAHAHWTRLAHAGRAPKGLAALRSALGPPVHRGERRSGSLTCEVACWTLPSWPELEFEALAGPGGEVWNQWFVRPGGGRALAFADLEPWTCVVADIGAAFPGATQLEGGAPHHWAADFEHAGATYRARFVYGLYQGLERLTR
ncbi:hypothetical protein [Nonomuraea sp. NPDC048826]|uniref:hypothetical protein n=1 Tax=Nonomuraea sp. NPDC048826 TaxID=3364347 RepID=UPI0037229D85